MGALSGEEGKKYPGLEIYEENMFKAIENIVYEVLGRLDFSTYSVDVPESVIGNPTFSDPDPSADYAERRNEIRRAEISRILDSILN